MLASAGNDTFATFALRWRGTNRLLQPGANAITAAAKGGTVSKGQTPSQRTPSPDFFENHPRVQRQQQ